MCPHYHMLHTDVLSRYTLINGYVAKYVVASWGRGLGVPWVQTIALETNESKQQGNNFIDVR